MSCASAKATLVRYADDFVILARYQGPRLLAWVEQTLEGWLGLTINRDKTRVVNLNDEGSWLDFLGYRFRYQGSLYGGDRRYLNLEPSPKSLAREREQLRQIISPRWGFLPVPELIQWLNRHLAGWREYFKLGYPRRAFRKIGWFVSARLLRHLRRRSQRPFRTPKGTTPSQHLLNLGLLPM